MPFSRHAARPCDFQEQLEEILAGRVTSSLSPEERAECIAEASRRIEAEEPQLHGRG